MPTYIYRREDGTTFEAVQRISEDPLTVCPETGQPVQRVISGAGLVFKGSGFYLTDYVKKGGDDGEKKGEGSKEAKSEPKADKTEKTEKKEKAPAKASPASE